MSVAGSGILPIKSDIIIVRGDKRLHFNYQDWVKGKKLDQDITVENGDTILVKE